MVLGRVLVGDDSSAGAVAARRWAEALAAASGARVTVAAVESPSAPNLLAAADNLDASLVVVGQRGAGGFEGLRLGSTAHQLAEHSGRPVAVVPANWDSPTGGAWPFATVEVGHDGSSTAVAALSWAASLAGPAKATLVVVHALGIGPVFAAAGLDDAYERSRAQRAATVDREWCASLREAGIPYTTVVEDGGAAAVLLEAARIHDVGLLVVGRQAVGSFPGMAMGSVAHRALGFAPCPTIVVPARA
jgi:nucleotide-binding universal stress UspA family protein